MLRAENIREMIIKLLGNRDLHGYDIHKELEARGMKLGISRLYEILNRMHEEGLLNDKWIESVSGPKKRVYSLNSKGRTARQSILMDAIQTVHEFYGEYLRSLPPDKSAFTIIAKQLANDLDSDSNIAYVSMKYTKPIKMMLVNLSMLLPTSTIYLVGPRMMVDAMELDLPNLAGQCNSIPAKDSYFDLIVLPGFSGVEDLESCVREWLRVLKSGGKVVITTPSALLKTPEDPMTIGEFMETHEHPSQFEDDIVPEDSIKRTLAKHFDVVETNSVIHLTLISAIKH